MWTHYVVCVVVRGGVDLSVDLSRYQGRYEGGGGGGGGGKKKFFF